MKKASPESVEGDKGKNGGAIAGFILSVLGVLLGVLGLVALRAGLIVWTIGFLGLICCVAGIILSAIGLKSEKRGLAIAGLVIGIAPLVIVLGFILWVVLTWEPLSF